MPRAANQRWLDLTLLKLSPGARVTATVVDPTPFVRDPEIRTKLLTAVQTWTVGTGLSDSVASTPIAGGTQYGRPVGGRDVLYVVPVETSQQLTRTVWSLNGTPISEDANSRTFALAPKGLSAGKHTVAVTVSGPTSGTKAETRTWTIDNTEPTVAATIATPVVTIAGAEPHYFVRDEFMMKLDPTDDQPGYVVAEFRVNGDGWHHYYGWPDAPPGTPFKFTPRGTTIKELVYGSLASEGLSPQPWEPREPGWGTHRIEYRGIDAAGNIGTAKAFKVTLESAPVCTATITGKHQGDLVVKEGVTCLSPGTTVAGQVTVASGASLMATKATVTGGLTATGASTIELVGVSVSGSVRLSGSIARITVFGSTIGGDLSVAGSKTAKPPTLVGNSVKGQK
jgi:hypothetical protein